QGLESAAFESTGTHAHTYTLGSVDLSADAGQTTKAVLAKLQAIVAALPALPKLLCLVNNAGSIGDLSKTVDQYAADEIASYTSMNFVSYASLTSGFLEYCGAMGGAVEKVAVVNISSLLAVQAFANWGLYAALKAARDRFLEVAALETQGDGGRTRLLSYAPGPLDNDMQAEVRASIMDPEQRKIYGDMHRQGKLVRVQDSAKAMCDLLDKWEFQSGAHIDYYDV
ncbi:hypothetical protein LPJ75_000974, partial [Coemansia sp. RSA 2598]